MQPPWIPRKHATASLTTTTTTMTTSIWVCNWRYESKANWLIVIAIATHPFSSGTRGFPQKLPSQCTELAVSRGDRQRNVSPRSRESFPTFFVCVPTSILGTTLLYHSRESCVIERWRGTRVVMRWIDVMVGIFYVSILSQGSKPSYEQCVSNREGLDDGVEVGRWCTKVTAKSQCLLPQTVLAGCTTQEVSIFSNFLFPLFQCWRVFGF